MSQSFLRFFRGAPADAAPAGEKERQRRRSSGFNEFTRTIGGSEGLCVLDLGPTSPANITHVTGLGHRIYNEDVLLASRDPSLVITNENGSKGVSVPRFLEENLAYKGPQFDAVLCWDI